MKNRKKITIEDPIHRPYESIMVTVSDENKCSDLVYNARAQKEKDGCIKCGANLWRYQKVSGRPCYQCPICLNQVYIKAGTIFDHSHVPLKDWFYVAINKIHHNSGFSANRIAYQLSLGDGTAWNLLKKVRQWMAMADSDNIKLEGYIEGDETGLNTGSKGLGRIRKKKRGFGSINQTICFTIVQRDGKIKSFIVPDRDETTLLQIISDNVTPGSIISTDEWRSYRKLKNLGYKHITVVHSKKQFKNGSASTNRLEGYFGLVKPNLTGTYRQISETHAQDYMAEHDFRYNNRMEPLHVRFQKLLDCLPPLFEHVRNRNNDSNDTETIAA
jgi:transposase